METNHLHIFKTNIKDVCPNCEISKVLNNNSYIQHWSLDTDDTDCVLRIASDVLSSKDITIIITGLGHFCQELD